MLGRIVLSVLAVSVAFGQSGESPAQTAPAARQESEPGAPQSQIRVQVNEVIVPVTVTDEKGRFVSDLDVGDFQIFDDGKPQTIKFFSRERNQPVVVGFLIDQSNASRIHWKTYKDAIQELIWALLPHDDKFSGYLISYSTDAELLANTTNDPEKLVEKVRNMKPGGGAALFDAVYMACTSRALVKGEPIEPRRVIVIVGDGHDTSSKHTMAEVLELAQRNLVTIYGVSTVAFGFNVQGEKNLTRLAEETGGRVEYPLQGVYSDVSGYLSTPSDEGNYALKVGTGGYAAAIAKGIFEAVANVTGEVTTQYVIRYVPDTSDVSRQFRTIEVKVPTLPGVVIRARKGYYPYEL
ncbi:MAG: VWA domain-containing protein [Bryobacteraceae bacterium]|nr:VWA domain-containing protein [Bryobacterales bacterium]MEB2360002.1 VWA domain-containing protein [Bryobacterales bacterium]NUN02799.1 VWA domain-containing protein [Bryobacteraceae bacterium]